MDRAACWARRGGRAEALDVMRVAVWVVRVCERARRRASFSGLGGTGGPGRVGWLGFCEGRVTVRESSRRLGGGAGAGGGACC